MVSWKQEDLTVDGAIQPLISNPAVGYRLDPDEPGVANPAKASRSAYTVVGQESRNRARLRSKALLEGRQILVLKTEYKVRQAGSFLVPVGGLTTIVTRDRPEKQEAAPLENRPAARAGPSDSAEDAYRLRAERQRLERELRAIQQQQQTISPYEAEQSRLRTAAIEQRLDEIEADLRQAAALGGIPQTPFVLTASAAAAARVGTLLDVTV